VVPDVTCPESITRRDDTRSCIRTGRHREHYTAFRSDEKVKGRWGMEYVLEVYTWCDPR
jgi:hypothetical protein